MLNTCTFAAIMVGYKVVKNICRKNNENKAYEVSAIISEGIIVEKTASDREADCENLCDRRIGQMVNVFPILARGHIVTL